MSQPKYELLRQAYAILDGIPEDRIDLSLIYCGNVACGLGWLAMHPKFQKLGLGLTTPSPARPRGITYKEIEYDFDEAASFLFKITEEDAFVLFMPNTFSREFIEDKSILLNRIRCFLAGHRQLDSQLQHNFNGQ